MSDGPASSTSPPPTIPTDASKRAVIMRWNGGDSEVGASSTFGTSAPTVQPTASELERHLDAGLFGRSSSGRLPPAYGEQVQ